MIEKQNCKNIKVIAKFCGDLNSNNRFLYIAKEFRNMGHNVELITGTYNHFTKSFYNNEEKKNNDYKITMLKEMPYEKNISIKRFISHYFWGIKVIKYLKSIPKPDIVYLALPTLKCAKEVSRYCKKNNIYCVIDIQDLWPKAFEMRFNIPIIKNIVFYPFNILLEKAIKNADYITAVSKTYMNYAKKINKRVKCSYFYLGTNYNEFQKNSEKARDILKRQKLKKKKYWIGYCGSLTQSYDLTKVIDALDENMELIVMGEGDKKGEFINHTMRKNKNVIFTGRLPYNEMCAILSCCDIAINPVISNSPATICNKHADYAAAGIPIVNMQNCSEYIELIKNYSMGKTCLGTDKELNKALNDILNSKKLRKIYSIGAKECAKTEFNRKKTYKKELINIIEQYCLKK